MHDADAIEAINFEQLVTVTDRLLLRGTGSKRRPSSPSLARASSSTIPVVSRTPVSPPAARGIAAGCEHTMIVRPLPARGSRAQLLAVTVMIPALVGIALGLAALL
jgi:hypothetical protein